MGEDAADALDLREAQVVADADGQRVESPQDQPGGRGVAQWHSPEELGSLTRPEGDLGASQPPAKTMGTWEWGL